MKTMNKFVVLFGVALIGVTACNDESGEPSIDEIEQSADVTQDISETEEIYEDIDDLSTEAVDQAFNNTFGGKASNEDERLDAPCVVKTRSEGQLIIDYGQNGCELPNGNVRKGKIIVSWTGSRWRPGSVVTIELDSFSINDNKIFGTRILTNLNQSTEEAPLHRIEMIDGRIEFTDGTVATRNADRTRLWLRASNPLNDEVHILEGSSASGITRAGVSYTSEATTDLIFARDCRISFRRFFLPVEGVRQVTRNNEPFTIDYGDGTCDALATITDEDGNTQEVNLRRFN